MGRNGKSLVSHARFSLGSLGKLTRYAEEPLDGLDEDREAKCQQEDSVDQCSENLGSVPAVGVFSRGNVVFGELDGVERYY